MREHEKQIKTADGLLDTFITHPDEGGPFPAVILYMDAPAIREELRDMARRIATCGYYVALPNLYYRDGREGSYGFDFANFDEAGRERMFELMNSLTNEKIVADTGPLLAAIREDENAASGPVGCVGYCMSGKFVIAVGAAYADDFAAIASYYGVGIVTDEPDSPHLKAGDIKGEVYMAFAAEDIWVPEKVLKQIPETFDAAGVSYRMEIYPGTDHGFAFPGRDAYVKLAGERHWHRMLALFDRNLKRR